MQSWMLKKQTKALGLFSAVFIGENEPTRVTSDPQRRKFNRVHHVRTVD
jgi:hypothetical protein